MSATPDAVDTVRQEIAVTRKVKGWSQDYLSQRSGVPRGTIAGIEAGNHEPKRPALRKLARALGVPPTRWDRMLDGLPPDVDVSAADLATLAEEQDPEIRQLLLDALRLPPDLRDQFAAVVRAALAAVQAAQRR